MRIHTHIYIYIYIYKYLYILSESLLPRRSWVQFRHEGRGFNSGQENIFNSLIVVAHS